MEMHYFLQTLSVTLGKFQRQLSLPDLSVFLLPRKFISRNPFQRFHRHSTDSLPVQIPKYREHSYSTAQSTAPLRIHPYVPWGEQQPITTRQGDAEDCG